MSRGLRVAAEALAQAASAVTEGAFAAAEAVGFGVDDVHDPHCAVIVRGGRVAYEGVAPGLLKASVEVQADALRAARHMAAASYLAQRRGEVPVSYVAAHRTSVPEAG